MKKRSCSFHHPGATSNLLKKSDKGYAIHTLNLD
jgi:hypothetical protein